MRTIIRRLSFTASLAAISLLAVGCANQTTSYRMQRFGPNRPMVVTVDANLRHTIMIPESEEGRANGWRTCSEAAPDVFSALSASAAAEAGIQRTSTERSAQLRGALSIAQTAATIERTQTINLLRESLFRTCERYLSGGMGPAALAIQAGRDLRAMIAVLAIEQLTRTTRPPSTVISAGTTSANITSTAGARRQLQEAERRLRNAQREKAEAEALTCPAVAADATTTTTTTTTPTPAPAPAAVPAVVAPAFAPAPTPPPAPAATETTTTTSNAPAATGVSQTCASKQDAIDAASDKIEAAQAEVERWRTVVISGAGDTIGAETGVGPNNAGGGGSAPSDASLRYVASVVGDITRRAFETDETQLVCLQMMQDSRGTTPQLSAECLRYLMDKVRAERANLFRSSAAQEMGYRISLDIEVARLTLIDFLTSLPPAAYSTERQAIAALLPGRRFCEGKSQQQCVAAVGGGEIDLDASLIPGIVDTRTQAGRQR